MEDFGKRTQTNILAVGENSEEKIESVPEVISELGPEDRVFEETVVRKEITELVDKFPHHLIFLDTEVLLSNTSRTARILIS